MSTVSSPQIRNNLAFVMFTFGFGQASRIGVEDSWIFALSCCAGTGFLWIPLLLFADDTALVADSEEKLCRLVSEFGIACERRKLRVNDK